MFESWRFIRVAGHIVPLGGGGGYLERPTEAKLVILINERGIYAAFTTHCSGEISCDEWTRHAGAKSSSHGN